MESPPPFPIETDKIVGASVALLALAAFVLASMVWPSEPARLISCLALGWAIAKYG